MMSSLSRRYRLPGCKVISSALGSLPLNGDGRRLQLTKITITVKFCSLSFLVPGIFTCTGWGGGQGWLVGNCSSRPLFREQKYKRPSWLNTIQSVAPYCAAQMKDGQWKAGLQWDSIWLICNETNQSTNANRCTGALSIKGRWVKCWLSFLVPHKGQSALHLYVFIASQSRRDGLGPMADHLRALRRY